MSAAPILVFGRRGQLAQELARLDSPSRPVVCAGRELCDLAKGADPEPLLHAVRPAMVINAAAYTAVDRAEVEHEAADTLNRAAPAAIALACARMNLPFIHLSTDYVFDGTKGAAYRETDSRSPLGVYGAAKAAGEDGVLAAGGRAAVVRIGWLYSAFGSNFPKTMLRLAQTCEEIGVVNDQIGRPTSARFVAETLLDLGGRMVRRAPSACGVFHLAPRGDATWADFAEFLFSRSALRGGPTSRVKRITTADYPTPARRPADSRLDASKLETLLDTRFPDWREPLDALIAELVPAQATVRA